MLKNQIITKSKAITLTIIFANALIEKKLKKKATTSLENAIAAKAK